MKTDEERAQELLDSVDWEKVHIENMLADTSEQIQENIMCILDGLDDDIVSKVCQVVCDKFDELETNLFNKE